MAFRLGERFDVYEHNYKNAMITERTLQSVIIAFLFCINGDKKYPDAKQKYRFELICEQ